MALLNKSFITDEAEDMSFDLLPTDCDYTALIEKSSIEPTKDGNGEYIKNQWKIIDADDPKHIGRLLWQYINTVNASEMAVKIGASMLKQINKVLGIAELVDTDELLNQPMKIRLKIQKGKDGYDDSNQITKVLPVEDASPDAGSVAGGDSSTPWAE